MVKDCVMRQADRYVPVRTVFARQVIHAIRPPMGIICALQLEDKCAPERMMSAQKEASVSRHLLVTYARPLPGVELSQSVSKGEPSQIRLSQIIDGAKLMRTETLNLHY